MTCTQFAVGLTDTDSGPNTISGAYCVKAGTEYDARDAAACSATCDPMSSPCL